MEIRNFTRVDYSGGASLTYNDNVVWGNIESLSLQGFYIKTSHVLPLNVPLEVIIHHSLFSSIHMHASAIYYEKTGVGIKINEIDVNSFVKLRDVILSKCLDQYLMMSETFKMAHLLH